MTLERNVAAHYERQNLEANMLDALRASGRDIDRLTVADLGDVDEFHMGGKRATGELAKALQLGPDTRLLDIGCGVGGPARFFASAGAGHVDGIDLTPNYVETAEALTRRLGLSDRVRCQVASALDLPFADATFDAATLIHVGMNIADKAQLFREMRRVLKPGGLAGVYDIMRVGEGELPYPMPWASAPDFSFVETPQTYRELLQAAALRPISETSRTELALELAREAQAAAARGAPSLLGPQLVMGSRAPEMFGNLIGRLKASVLAPTQIIAEAV